MGNDNSIEQTANILFDAIFTNNFDSFKNNINTLNMNIRYDNYNIIIENQVINNTYSLMACCIILNRIDFVKKLLDMNFDINLKVSIPKQYLLPDCAYFNNSNHLQLCSYYIYIGNNRNTIMKMLLEYNDRLNIV